MSLFLDITIKTSLILLFALAVVALMRQRSAALRHWVLSVALLCAAAAPVVQLVAPAWRLPERFQPREMIGVELAGVGLRTVEGGSPAIAPRGPETVASPAVPVATVLAATWLLGVVVCLASLLIGLAKLASVAARARRIDDGAWANHIEAISRDHGLRRPVTLLETSDPTLLITWGFRQPRVIVPAAARLWRDDRVSLVLHHELSHVRRRDWVVQLAAELMRAVYWFNPLVWMTCARLRQESEQACDDAVISRGVAGAVYAEHLVEIARDLQPRAPWIPAPAIARSSSLERRVRAMLDPRLDRRPLSRLARVASLVALLTTTTTVAGFAAAQGFASLAGSIVDPTNGVMPGVTLVLTNQQTGAKYELRSDRTGRYEFVGLPPGDYGLEAKIPGFAAFQGTVTLSGQNVEQNLTMQVGTLQETITLVVSDNDVPAPVDPDRQRAIDQVVEEKRQRRAATKCPGGPNTGSAPIGGNLRAPVKLRDVKPQYPASLRGTGIAGTVMLIGRIDTDGIIDELEVTSAPHPDLAAAAIEAVRQWQFDSTLLNCVPVEVSINVTMNFHDRP